MLRKSFAEKCEKARQFNRESRGSATQTTRGQDLSEKCSLVRYLDRGHTIFEQVTECMDVVIESLAATKRTRLACVVFRPRNLPLDPHAGRSLLLTADSLVSIGQTDRTNVGIVY